MTLIELEALVTQTICDTYGSEFMRGIEIEKIKDGDDVIGTLVKLKVNSEFKPFSFAVEHETADEFKRKFGELVRLSRLDETNYNIARFRRKDTNYE